MSYMPVRLWYRISKHLQSLEDDRAGGSCRAHPLPILVGTEHGIAGIILRVVELALQCGAFYQEIIHEELSAYRDVDQLRPV